MALPVVKSLYKYPATPLITQIKKLGLFRIDSLLKKPEVRMREPFTICPVPKDSHEQMVDLMKKYYLKDHVFVQSRNMELDKDTAFDEYLYRLLRQDKTLYAYDEQGYMAGFCVNAVSTADDQQELRNYAYYRQNPNTKDFLYFMAKLQETPNFWNMFNQKEIFEIKMIAVLPEYRRQGIASLLVQKAQQLAIEQNYKVVRFDCINPYDYKIAERCMMQCVTKYPLHKLRGAHAPFIKKSKSYNRYVRVYSVGDLTNVDTNTSECKEIEIA